MGARGPAPTAKKVLAARGSKRARKRAADLELPAGTPAAPDHLDAEAIAEWRRIVPVLASRGVLSELDRAGLTVLCEAWSEYLRIGAVLEGKQKRLAKMDARALNAWRRLTSARHEAYTRWQNVAQRFGLTPADRPRVKTEAPDAAADAKSAYFGPRLAKAE